MDGRGRCLDNVFVERLWRSLKYEEVYLHAYDSPADAKAGIDGWMAFYNETRPHQALDNRTPADDYSGANGRATPQVGYHHPRRYADDHPHQLDFNAVTASRCFSLRVHLSGDPPSETTSVTVL